MGEKKKQELVVKRVKVARVVTKNGAMICKYGRQLIKWICAIGYTHGEDCEPKGQCVGCMTMEENSSNLFQLNKVHNLTVFQSNLFI